MTLKYKPVSKRVHFAKDGDNTATWSYPDNSQANAITLLELLAERIGNYLGYNDALKNELLTRLLNPTGRQGSWLMTNGLMLTGNAIRNGGKSYVYNNHDRSLTRVDDSNHVLFPLLYSSAFRGDDARAILDWVPVVGDVLQGQDAFNAARTGDYLTAGTTAALMFLPGAVGKRLSPYINKGMRRMLNNLDPDSWLSRRLFGNNPNAIRRLRGEPYTETIEDISVTRNPNGVIEVDRGPFGREVYNPGEIGLETFEGSETFMGRDGFSHLYNNDPYRSSLFTPEVEQRALNIVELSRDPFARERDILNRAAEGRAANPTPKSEPRDPFAREREILNRAKEAKKSRAAKLEENKEQALRVVNNASEQPTKPVLPETPKAELPIESTPKTLETKVEEKPKVDTRDISDLSDDEINALLSSKTTPLKSGISADKATKELLEAELARRKKLTLTTETPQDKNLRLKAGERAKLIVKKVTPGKKTGIAAAATTALTGGYALDLYRVDLHNAYNPDEPTDLLGELLWDATLGSLFKGNSPKSRALLDKERLDEIDSLNVRYNKRMGNSTTTTSKGDTVIVSKDLKKIDLGVEDFDPLELEELIKLSISTAK